VTGLLDTSGNPTGVNLTTNATAVLGIPGSGDFAALMNDQIGAVSNLSVSFTGLTDGSYTVYLYDGEDPRLSIGAGSVNGVAFGSANDPTGTLTSFVEGTNFLRVPGVTVTGGALLITTSGPALDFAGLQLVPTATAPEPSSLVLLGTGGIALARRVRRK
jgi:hypothetical protein